jgi:hypothetical protein
MGLVFSSYLSVLLYQMLCTSKERKMLIVPHLRRSVHHSVTQANTLLFVCCYTMVNTRDVMHDDNYKARDLNLKQSTMVHRLCGLVC